MRARIAVVVVVALVGGWFWWPYVDRCELVRGTWLDGWCDYGGSSGAQ
jgi:hypothetical protein